MREANLIIGNHALWNSIFVQEDWLMYNYAAFGFVSLSYWVDFGSFGRISRLAV